MIIYSLVYRWRNSCRCASRVHFRWLTAKKYILFLVMERTPCGAVGRMGTRSFNGMFMLSIKGWAVIKTHFYLNECKLAHLLWWASCPDSSISMIDQLSSCWWLTANEMKEHEKKNEQKTVQNWINQMLYLIKRIMEFHLNHEGAIL